jgi:hypothetical protein
MEFHGYRTSFSDEEKYRRIETAPNIIKISAETTIKLGDILLPKPLFLY